MNISPEVSPINTHHDAVPVSDAITGFIFVVVGAIAVCGLVWAWRTFG